MTKSLLANNGKDDIGKDHEVAGKLLRSDVFSHRINDPGILSSDASSSDKHSKSRN